MPAGPWLSGIGNQLVIGAGGAPQVEIDTTLNLTVVFNALTVTDVASVTPIKAAIRFPTNNPNEATPALMASVVVTYTDGDVTTGTLILGSISSGPASAGLFELFLSFTHLGTHSGGTLMGGYTIAGSTVTLTPGLSFASGFSDIMIYTPGGTNHGIQVKDQTATGLVLVPSFEPWHNLGSTGLAGDGGTSQFRLTAEGEVQLSIHSSFNALGGITSASFANALPGAYIPPAARLTGGVPVSLVGAAPGAGTRLTITGGTGVVNLVNLPAGTTAVGCDVRVPLT